MLNDHRFIYFSLAIVLLSVEIFIALSISSTSFIRHSLGDFFVVMLIYFSIRTILDIKAKTLAIATFLLALTIELTQYIQLLDKLDIQNEFIRIVLGTSFSYGDLIMYFLGSICSYAIDSWWINRDPS